jgi:GNAT superfamily N-acetyltransferase
LAVPADLQLVPFNPSAYPITDFDCDDADLNDFLRSDAGAYEEQHLGWTTVAVSGGRVCGYMTLSADSIILMTPEKKSWLTFHKEVKAFPAMKIGRLGAQKECQRTGIGTALLKHAIGTVARLNADLRVGCRFITVDAYPKSVSWYLEKGFSYNKHYKDLERTNKSMRYDILLSKII